MNRGAMLLGGAAAVGVLVVVAGSAGPVTTGFSGWIESALRRVSASEGQPDSLNRNLDGNGLSYGVIQWTQRSGSLGTLLAAMQAADPDAFARIFGPSWREVLAVTARRSLDAIDGAYLWEEPWASRFVQAGRYAPFVSVQWLMASQGDYAVGADRVAAVLNVRTERAMVLFFDRCVHQGPRTAIAVAGKVRDHYVGRGRLRVDYSELLEAYAWTCASRFRRTSAPETRTYSKYAPSVVWTQVGAEWHAFAGPWDLYETVVLRCRAILDDPALSDAQPSGVQA